MRATRTQQLRQGGAQAQLMNRQLATMSAMNNLISKQIQYISRLDGNQKIANRQLGDVNRNLNSLSSTFTKSFSNFANSMAKGAGRSVMAVGGAAASATGSIATSIASGIGRVLPTAIAGYVAKSVVWDNMSAQTRDKIASSMGDLFAQAMAGINSTELGKAMTQAIGPAVGKARDAAEKIQQRLPSVGSAARKARETAEDIIESPTTARVARTGKLVSEKLGGAAQKGYELAQQGVEMVGGAPNALKGAGLGVSAYYVAKGVNNLRQPSAANVPTNTSVPSQPPSAGTKSISGQRMEAMRRVSGGPGGSMDPKTKKAIETLKSSGSKATKLNIAVARAYNSILGGAGNASRVGKLLFEALKKVKFSIPAVLSALIEYGMLSFVETEIQAMVELNQMSKEEADVLISNLRTEATGRVIGGTVFGTLGAVVAGGATFGLGSVVGGVAGGIGGSYVGEKIAGLFTKKLPSSLNDEVQLAEQDPAFLGGNSTKDIINARKQVLERKFDESQNAKRTRSELPQASMTQNLDDLPIEGAMGQYREMVAKYEGGAAGYDAMYGVLKESDVQKYKEKETGGKRLTEMTIDEIIALQKKRKASNTHAMGKYQFIDVAAAAGLAGLKGTDIFSPANQDKMFDAYTKGNAETLKNLNVPVNAYTLRLAHAVGPKGVKKLLDADPNASPADVLGLKGAERTSNPQLSKQGVTVASYLGSIQQQAGGGGGGTGSYTDTQSTAVATATPTAQDKPSFNQKLASMFSGGMKFEDIIGGGYKNLTEELQTGYENIKGAEMKSKQSTNIVNGGSTTVVNNVQNSSSPFGGSGVSAEGYTSQFNSLAGFRVA